MVEEITNYTANLSVSEDSQNEILALEAIFAEQITRKPNGTSALVLEIKLTPSFDDSSPSYKRFLTLFLHISLSRKYPSASPVVNVVKQRGFSEEDLGLLDVKISSFLRENRDVPILYELILLVQEFVDQHEISNIPCSICLTEFDGDDDVFITECGHNFHGICLLKCLQHQREEAQKQKDALLPHLAKVFDMSLNCPVCRKKLSSESVPDESLLFSVLQEDTKLDRAEGSSSNLRSLDSLDFDWNGWRAKQREMNKIFEIQKQKGGIIDLEEEDKKFLVTEDTRIVLPCTKVEQDALKDSADCTEITNKENRSASNVHQSISNDSVDKSSSSNKSRNYDQRRTNHYHDNRNYQHHREHGHSDDSNRSRRPIHNQRSHQYHGTNQYWSNGRSNYRAGNHYSANQDYYGYRDNNGYHRGGHRSWKSHQGPKKRKADCEVVKKKSEGNSDPKELEGTEEKTKSSEVSTKIEIQQECDTSGTVLNE